MDMQKGIMPGYANANAVASNIRAALAHARRHGIMVIYVRVGFREGTPEISVNNKLFSASKSRFAGRSMDEWMAIDDTVAPAGDEIIVTKKRISAFTGSDLEVLLRAQSIGHLVLTGISTSGVVLSTLREAADKDFRLTVLSDGCTDADEEVHRVLTTKVFPRQAEVMTIADWTKTTGSL